jgi:hypothetical protein
MFSIACAIHNKELFLRAVYDVQHPLSIFRKTSYFFSTHSLPILRYLFVETRFIASNFAGF